MICLLEPVEKKRSNTPGSNHMSVLPLPLAGEHTGERDNRDSRRVSYGDDVGVPLQTIADCGKHLDYYEKSRLSVGVIIHTAKTTHRALAALANPASKCKVTALAILKPPPSFSQANLLLGVCPDDQHGSCDDEPTSAALTPGSIMRRWMRDNNLGNHSEPVAVYGGEEGAQHIVKRDDVDALFIIVPDE
jgi:hypothetical protein